jgi:hypothetical protein
MKARRTAMVVMVACLLSFMAHDALAFYNPSTGRWLSRDPIGEKGGRNRYGFVQNAPLSFVDAVGKLPIEGPTPPIHIPPAMYPPPTPFPQKLLKHYDCSCCGPSEIEAGKKELIGRFQEGKDYLDGKNLTADAEADKPGEASCDRANGAILNFIDPTPRCWICFIDRRWAHIIGGWDENFIHCYTKNNGGIRDELILDWFDSAIYGGSGVYGNVNGFYDRYPYPAHQYGNVPVYVDCAAPEDTWKRDESKFDGLFTGYDPPVNR